MNKRISTRVALFVTAIPLAAAVGYRTLVPEQSQQAVVPDSVLTGRFLVPPDEEQSTSSADGVSHANQIPATVGRSGLHQNLLEMPERYRNNIFWLTIRDAGFKCDEVMGNQLLSAEIRTWRAHCGGISSYAVVFDEFGDIFVNPIPYGDFEEPVTPNLEFIPLE